MGTWALRVSSFCLLSPKTEIEYREKSDMTKAKRYYVVRLLPEVVGLSMF